MAVLPSNNQTQQQREDINQKLWNDNQNPNAHLLNVLQNIVNFQKLNGESDKCNTFKVADITQGFGGDKNQGY